MKLLLGVKSDTSCLDALREDRTHRHLDLTPNESEPTRACGAIAGSTTSFAFPEEIDCEACLAKLKAMSR